MMGNFTPSDDHEAVQAVVLAGAIKGNAFIRGQLSSLQPAFEEPYRTVASIVSKKLPGDFIDKLVLGQALGSRRLTRRAVNGAIEELTPEQVVNLIFATQPQPGQADVYMDILRARAREKQAADLIERTVNLAASHGDDLFRLKAEIDMLVTEAHQEGALGNGYPCELLELIPHVQRMNEEQRGTQFLGLDSGFQHLNYICNGLYTGLVVLAAPPGKGKTTLLWQIACQVAEANQVPVIFISMEQSKKELRAKAFARLSKLPYRHILRGRLRADDPHDWDRLLDSVNAYGKYSRHLTVVEGDDRMTVDTIRHVASLKKAEAGASRCLILVDYLQILPVAGGESQFLTGPRDRIDLHISQLRRLARDLDSPVMVISSENRAAYRGKKGLDVFKESGGIEYSADIAMVLTRSENSVAPLGGSAPEEFFRALDLNIIKNRNGETGVVKLKFYPALAKFIETGMEALPEEENE